MNATYSLKPLGQLGDLLKAAAQAHVCMLLPVY
ncbi:MAG: hypothetical protein ACJAZP_002776 [Psychromonas sp.]|jgi:hypothetical protein